MTGYEDIKLVQQKISKAGGPLTRAVTKLDAAAVGVTLYTPKLRAFRANGVAETEVEFMIELSSNGGPFVPKINDSFKGKSEGMYTRTYSIAVAEDGPWEIRVTRLTDDSLTDRVNNDLYWQSYNAIPPRDV